MHQPGDDAGIESIKGAPAGIQQAVEQEADFWASLWKSSMEYKIKDIQPSPNDRPKAITAAMIRSACKTFPITTGLGADTIQPRALLRLSDTALEGLANIMNAAEGDGSWPEFSQLVMTVLLPKSDGGRRPIGLFPTLHRVWMRVRRPCIKKWRREHGRPYRYGGAGKGAQRAAWLNAARAEMAVEGGRGYAAVLLDLVKAFEMIPHGHIIEAAKKHGYNLWILRMSLQAYRAPRTIVIDGVCSSLKQATLGITAGSGFATEELACLLLDVCYDVLKMLPNTGPHRVCRRPHLRPGRAVLVQR